MAAKVTPINESKFNKLSSTSNDSFSMNCAPIDIPIGFGGVPSGKIIEIRGKESLGKSSVSLAMVFAFAKHWIARKKEYRILWIETESAFDITRTIWMEPEIGVRIEIEEAETVETAHTVAKNFLLECLDTGTKGIIVWDTLAAAKTDAQKETGNQYGGGQMEQARYIRWMFRDITLLLGEAGCPLILPNQTYDGKPPQNPKAKIPQISNGGGAMKYHPSVRIDIQEHFKHMTEIAENGVENKIGIITKNIPIKNKITGIKLPFNLHINNEDGLDVVATTIAFLQDNKICEIRGAWKYMEDWDGEKISWQSTKQIKDKIKVHGDKLYEWMTYRIYEWYARSSPLVKLRIIDQVWDYEIKFLGKKVTTLTEREIFVGKKLEEFQIKEAEREEKKDAEEAKKKSAEIKAKKAKK